MKNQIEMKPEDVGGHPHQSWPYVTDRLGRYRLRRELGRGFSSVVYEAEDLQRQRTVALKVLTFLQNLSPERREDLSERFAREARAISALSHPGIVVIYEVGHADDGREFIAMEHLRGETLRARLQRAGALPPEEAVPITIQVAEALQYAHEHGIIHRDVKPDNVFLLPDGCVKLMDFGVAHVLSDEALTQTGTVVGSPAYMSPEQITGEHLDGRSDVFSLGVMLAEMVVGHKPFDAPTIPAVMHRILTRPPQMEAITPRALRKIIEKSLAKSRGMRFQSAAALADSLRRQVLPDLPVWEPTSTLLMPIPAAGPREISHKRRPPSHLVRSGLATVLVGLCSLGAFSLSIQHRATDHPAPLQQPAHSHAVTVTGRVRHISAYWQRLPGFMPHPPTQAGANPQATAAPIPRLTKTVRIIEGPIPKRSAASTAVHPLGQDVATVQGPSVTAKAAAFPSVPKDPQLAVSAKTWPRPAPVRFAPHPHMSALKIPVIKVGGFQQEQVFSPPIIPPVHSAPSADQDSEQIDPADAPSAPQITGEAPISGPRLLHRTVPVYPRTAWAAGLEGATTLRVLVDGDGNVMGAAVIESSGVRALDRAALRAVRDWEFEPAFRGGLTVNGQVTERINFSR